MIARFSKGDAPSLKSGGSLAVIAAARGHVRQLYQYAALLSGLKPAMDDWIAVERVPAFLDACARLRLSVVTDVVFNDLGLGQRGAPRERSPSTRASAQLWREDGLYAPESELHLFVGIGPHEAREAWAHGWYPLVIDGRLVEPFAGDFRTFGIALGYPACCISAFMREHDWRVMNSYEAAANRTAGQPLGLANPFGRHTAWSYVFHLPCSFDCAATVRYAAALRRALENDEPAYAAQIAEFQRSSFLVFNEQRVYALLGATVSAAAVKYEGVMFLGNLQEEDWYGEDLEAANEVTIRGTTVLLQRRIVVAIIDARSDCSGPESPLIISFS